MFTVLDKMRFSAKALKEQAAALGFNLAGITLAAPSPTLQAYFRWIDAGMQAGMGYMARADRQARRRDLNVILPGVRSLVVVGMDYAAAAAAPILMDVLHDPARGRIASYAWGVDYHDVLAARLEQLAGWLQARSGQDMTHRVYVDTGAILERSHGQQAGLGFIGKNTMLIRPRRGSAFFLGEILTDLEFDAYDAPHRATMCGTCRRCMNACPTDAFPEPYVLDARRCISYHTIENKGWIDRDLRAKMGNWVFGCDICQDVCPFQRFAPDEWQPDFLPIEHDRAAPRLLDLLALDAQGFHARYHGSPVARIKRDRLVRNACVAAGNWRDEQAVPSLTALIADANPLVRGHAAWALGQILGKSARSLLDGRLAVELDPQVCAEMELARG